CVVASSAIKPDNPELAEARARRIPIVPRAEMLAELMHFRRGIAVAGTHGKTTTTSLLASVLGEGGLDPTFVIGGKLLAAGANARLGGGDWLVAEADESDGSFLRLNPLVAIVTNIDADHLENYGGDFGRVQAAFGEFLHRLPFYGLAVLCIDDPEVARLAQVTSRHVMTYGFDAGADVRPVDVAQAGNCMRYTLCLPDGSRTGVERALPGRDNVPYSLPAASVGWQLGLAAPASPRALRAVAGRGQRRLAARGRSAGARARAAEVLGHRPPLQPAGEADHPQGRHRAAGGRLRPPSEGSGGGVRRRPRRLAGQAPGGGVPAAPLHPHPRPVRRLRRRAVQRSEERRVGTGGRC